MLMRVNGSGDSGESGVVSGRRRLLAAAMVGGVLARLPGFEPAEAKPKHGKRGNARLQAAEHKKSGGGTVVIETGPTIAAGPTDPNSGIVALSSTATCTQGAAVGGGYRTESPNNLNTFATDDYPSSPTAWTVTVYANEEGATLTPYVLCLV